MEISWESPNVFSRLPFIFFYTKTRWIFGENFEEKFVQYVFLNLKKNREDKFQKTSQE